MQSVSYIGLSAQMSLGSRLDVVAQNIANQTTPGYKSEEIDFSSLLSTTSAEAITFSSHGSARISIRPGEMKQTGSALDIAVAGDVWLGVKRDEGIALTRDGRLLLDKSGELKTASGYPVLDSSGSTIQLRPAGGAPTISSNGAIVQDGKLVGSIGLFQVPGDAKFQRADGLTVISDRTPLPVVDTNSFTVLQGFIEGSNVNPVKELTQLIEIQRKFDSITVSLNYLDATLADTIRSLTG